MHIRLMDGNELGARLDHLGWSQAELGRRLDRTPKAVSDWVTGKVPVPKYVSEYLWIALDLSSLLVEFSARIDRALEGDAS